MSLPRAYLDIRSGLVRHFHDKLGRRAAGIQEVQNVHIHCSAQVVNVGQEAIFEALTYKLLQET
jgi:hypothetical protein